MSLNSAKCDDPDNLICAFAFGVDESIVVRIR